MFLLKEMMVVRLKVLFIGIDISIYKNKHIKKRGYPLFYNYMLYNNTKVYLNYGFYQFYTCDTLYHIFILITIYNVN